MKKLQKLLLLAMIVVLGTFVAVPLIKDQLQSWRFDKLNELRNSTECDYLYTESGHQDDHLISMGICVDGKGYSIDTIYLPPKGEGSVLRTPMYPAKTGDESVRAWYGICGTPEYPYLMILLDEDNPTCRKMELIGADHRSLTLLQDQYRVETMMEELPGLLDSEDQLTVSLYAAEGADLELDFGYNMIERNAPNVVESSKEFEKVKTLYLTFSIDLTQALAETGW